MCNIKENMSLPEAMVRFYIAIFILVGAVSYENYLLLCIAIILIHGSIKRSCFVYRIFNINQKVVMENNYKTFLLNKNLAAILIFDREGKKLFSNELSKELLGDILILDNIGISKEKINDIFSSDSEEKMVYKVNEKSYYLTINNCKEQDIILVSLIDISDIIDV